MSVIALASTRTDEPAPVRVNEGEHFVGEPVGVGVKVGAEPVDDADLATLARNTVTTALDPAHEFVVHTRPTKLQQKALDLLAINPATCTQ